jgi:glutathione synthase/RimK-type ligase-like ATP-grasp enzyme
MKCKSPLLLTLSYSDQADRVEKNLIELGHKFSRFNADNPNSWFNYEFLDGIFNITFLDNSGIKKNINDFGSIWYDCVDPPDKLFSRYSHNIWAQQETKKALNWISNCSKIPMMDRLENVIDGHNKAKQLSRAVEFGFKIPSTLISSDLENMINFSSKSETIFKPIAKPEKQTFENGKVIYTTKINPDDLTKESVSGKLSLLQHYVPKKFELRIFVVGNEVLAAEIHNQNSEYAKIDWRKYDIPNTPHYIHNLPSEIASSCRNFVKSFGLRYSALDFIYDDNGEYVFLENNPQGLFQWIEDLTTLPVSKTIANELVNMIK